MESKEKRNITYLLGAGASAFAIPTIRKLYGSMKYFVDTMIKLLGVDGEEMVRGKRSEIYAILKDIKKFGTPDIVAKIALHKGEDEKVNDIKNLLSTYMLYEQMEMSQDVKTTLALKNAIKNLGSNKSNKPEEIEEEIYFELLQDTLDNRYVEFFSALLSGSGEKMKLPINVNFISWNYDHQIEKSLGIFSRGKQKEIQDLYEIYPLTDSVYFSKKEQDLVPLAQKSKIIKLNGTAGFADKAHAAPLFDLNYQVLDKATIEMLGKRLFQHSRATSSEENKLCFAWENTPMVNAGRKAAREKIANSDVIVVVG